MQGTKEAFSPSLGRDCLLPSREQTRSFKVSMSPNTFSPFKKRKKKKKTLPHYAAVSDSQLQTSSDKREEQGHLLLLRLTQTVAEGHGDKKWVGERIAVCDGLSGCRRGLRVLFLSPLHHRVTSPVASRQLFTSLSLCFLYVSPEIEKRMSSCH